MLAFAAGCGLRCRPTAAAAVAGTAHFGGAALLGCWTQSGEPSGCRGVDFAAHAGAAAAPEMSHYQLRCAELS